MILFRYSENLVRSGIITYNPADHVPVEGATDFLWMAMLAVLNGLHVPTYFATRLLSLVSLLGLGWIFARLVRESEYRPAFYPAIVLFIMLQVPLWAAYRLFRLLLCVEPVSGLLGILGKPLWDDDRMGFDFLPVRPDGCIFIAPLVAGCWLLNTATLRSGKNIAITATAAAIGVAYFCWRWHYFGLLLPLPFYVKADCPRVLGIVCVSSLEKHIASLLSMRRRFGISFRG